MKSFARVLGVLFLALQTSHSFAQDIQMPPNEYTDISTTELVPILSSNFGIRLNFERCADDPQSAVTVADILKLDGDPNITPKQKLQLESFKRDIKEGRPLHPDGICDWKQPRFDFKIPTEETAEALLNELVSQDKRYTWKKLSDSYILLPVTPKERGRFSFVEDKIEVGDAIAKVYTLVMDCHLGYAIVSLGPRPSSEPPQPSPPHFISIHLQNVDIYTLLTKFCEAVDSKMTWTITNNNVNPKADLLSFGAPYMEMMLEPPYK